MKTNNENRRGSRNSDASRDGKSFDKKNAKSFIKGIRTSSPSSFGSRNQDRNDRPAHDERSRNSGNSDNRFERKDDRPAYGEKRNFDNKRPFSDTDRKPYDNHSNNYRRSDSGSEKRPYGNRSNDDRRNDSGQERKPWLNKNTDCSGSERRPYGNRSNDDRRSDSGQERKPWLNRNAAGSGSERPRFVKKSDSGERSSDRPEFKKRFDNDERPHDGKLTFRKANEVKNSKFVETRFDNKKEGVTFRKRNNSADYDPNAKYSRKKQFEYRQTYIDPTKPIRLNKFLSNAGICSRREADEYIQAGVISVNGEIVVELGSKVLPTDNVMFHNQPVRIEKKIYLLLNKPKDCVTTSEDTHSRTTVIDIVKNACSERIYPVGRLDRNTTGVLLLTNDGDLASKLTHPKYDKKKIYHVGLDRDLEQADFEAIMNGIDLGDFTIKPDALEFVKEDSLSEVGIEIHSGQNRVVRRIFDKLGYKIIKLDRVFFAGLTKKNIPRGKYRFLTEKEVNILKMGAHE